MAKPFIKGFAFPRGDVYIANLNPAFGREQGGIRPVVILQNNLGNKHSPTTIVAAIAQQNARRNFPAHVDICLREIPNYSVVFLEQIRTIDLSRLRTYFGRVSTYDMKQIDYALKISTGLIMSNHSDKSSKEKRTSGCIA